MQSFKANIVVSFLENVCINDQCVNFRVLQPISLETHKEWEGKSWYIKRDSYHIGNTIG